MECIKTGCNCWLEEYQMWAYGDAFELIMDGGPGSLIWVHTFRIVSVRPDPIVLVKHFTVHKITYWFDEHKPLSTLLSTSATNHGYEGVPI